MVDMLKDLFEKTINKPLSVAPYMESLKLLNSGALEDVMNTNGCAYYLWTTELVKEIRPKQVIELGGAMGVWSLLVLQVLPPDSKLYSITLPEGGLDFAYIDRDYPNFFPVRGDDLDLRNWPKDIDLSQTDLWFFDSKHEEEHLRKELVTYSPYFKPGAIVLFDDIHSFGLEKVWNELSFEKLDITDPCHYSGFGMVKI